MILPTDVGNNLNYENNTLYSRNADYEECFFIKRNIMGRSESFCI